ncbi:methyltransferase domain-containing protein [Ketogulonicigenium vulgare]|uniref:Methyltransferase type 12 n=2 Tax=Ketogulonicigenium vulgare TaxID=92945 RepID=F9Y3X9_KETVW|nr:methyltransferase domain-containing protein [Ketogulonicigenium vulgare]AEM41670.1 hypothetical protein KVU_1831 [Ketogulonicigenium vulgare WSH-001]ALJ82404.1 hypothetical protein KVH_11780 [Ketogulonicigenium vulgare]ANW34436.1 hypothetical protein KvSKV_11695 [Ketogulonicigenium vulgare]
MMTDVTTCLICAAPMRYYFTKTYNDLPAALPYAGFSADYHRCDACGFVASKTHQDMSDDAFGALNNAAHAYFEALPLAQRGFNQPPYAEQALALAILGRNGIVDLGRTLDYAAGHGTLAGIMARYFDHHIATYDKYIASDGHDPARPPQPARLVINSAMFEHVTTRAALDALNDLVTSDGVLMLHSVICDRVPADPDWFYLRPIVHCAFHTNASMEVLMQQWGYAASIYAPKAKSWFLFKAGYPDLEHLPAQIAALNTEFQTEMFIYKSGFVDFWKGF